MNYEPYSCCLTFRGSSILTASRNVASSTHKTALNRMEEATLCTAQWHILHSIFPSNSCCIHGDMHRSQLHWHIQTSALYSSQIHSSFPGIKPIVSLSYLPCAWYRGQSDVMQHLMFILYGRMLPPAVDETRGVPARALYKPEGVRRRWIHSLIWYYSGMPDEEDTTAVGVSVVFAGWHTYCSCCTNQNFTCGRGKPMLSDFLIIFLYERSTGCDSIFHLSLALNSHKNDGCTCVCLDVHAGT